MNAETQIKPRLRQDPRPASAVSAMVGVAGLIGLGAWLVAARHYRFDGPDAALVALAACGLPMLLWSLWVDRVHRNPSTGIDWDKAPRPWSEALDTGLVKLAGLWATWGAIGSLYCIGRWYWNGNYLYAMELLGYAALPLLLLSVPYVLWLDRRLIDPRDGAWHFGRLVIGRPAGVDRAKMHDYLLSWAVKGFFLAFMISIVPGNWADAVRAGSDEILSSSVVLTRWLIAVMFMVDVCFATVGYALTMKPLDGHIRSANPFAAGWTAALICYPPFILMQPGGPLDYRPDDGNWIRWLDGHPTALAAMGLLLVVLTGIYAWATVAFGIRFSNLTNRGILTHGPYAFSKHPAYLAKNLFWWLSTLPFLVASGNPVDMIRNTALLAIVSGVYYWRARTEERHLSADPAYRDYAAWMERNGLVPRAIRALTGRQSRLPVPAE
jgi:protein-S-isoprenylcysteine O-methyltransferase Ste14